VETAFLAGFPGDGEDDALLLALVGVEEVDANAAADVSDGGILVEVRLLVGGEVGALGEALVAAGVGADVGFLASVGA